ncbi:MAG: GAF domain-containing protein [Acidobacteria bacterium]|nr:GAF domain-containing protein [Acidobacteriota bacterium]
MTEIPELVTSAGDLAAALNATVAHFGADSGTIHLIGDGGALHLRAATAGIPQFVLDTVRVVPVGKGMAGLAAERAQPVTACNIQTDTSGDVRPGAKLTGLEGAIVVPMIVDGAVRGSLGIANRRERTFTKAEQHLLLAIGAFLAARNG